MKTTLLMLSLAVSCTLAAKASALTKEEYKVQNDQIAAGYKVNKAKCDAMSGNAKDICVTEAKGADKIAKAELEAQYKPSAKHTEDVRMAKGDAAYDSAKEKCDDLSGNGKDVCVKEAKAAHVKAKQDAKVARVSADSATSNKVTDARKNANAEKNEANYKVAKEKCDALAGSAKEACLSDAKLKFGMK